MPSKSKKQAKLMRAAAHGWKKPGGGGPSKSVAKKFMNADMGLSEDSVKRTAKKAASKNC